jgi:hypothetical protein
MASVGASSPPRTSTVSSRLQSEQVVRRTPSVPSAARMPNPSHTQVASQLRPATSAVCPLGTPENGFAIRMPPSARRTSACDSARRR